MTSLPVLLNRDAVIEKLNKILDNLEISKKLENSVYEFVENENLEKQSNLFIRIYHNKIVSLYNNLNPKNNIKNINFRNKVLSNSIDFKQIPYMTPQEIFPEHWKLLMDKQKETDEFLYLKRPVASTDEYKCAKCKERKCSYYELQVRSSDEPMTRFVQCLVCDNRWSCSA